MNINLKLKNMQIGEFACRKIIKFSEKFIEIHTELIKGLYNESRNMTMEGQAMNNADYRVQKV